MKKPAFIPLFLVFGLFSGCGNRQEKVKTENIISRDSLQFFGDTIALGGATPANQLLKEIRGKDSLKVKVTGIIEDVCQKKGCWMDINTGEGKTMKVRFKDYGFFIPKNAKGKTAIFEGIAYTDTVSVNELKHYAEDEGKTKEEISKITKPEISLSFEAH